VSFLTRVPAGVQALDESELAESVVWFPVVGAAIGAAAGAIFALCLQVMPAPLSAAIAIVTGVLLTGGFHEDGLADSLDALGSGAEPERARAILKDPTHGTFGVLGLVASLLIRVLALATFGAAAGIAALVVAHACGRGAALAAMAIAPSSDDGLGAAYARSVRRLDVAIGVAVASAVAGALIGPLTIAAAFVAGLGAIVLTRLAVEKLEGVGGDILGAVEQTTEIGVLVVCASAVSQGWLSIPWWA
jgi:adenosylcobinamide-GDP ribazoletransferase